MFKFIEKFLVFSLLTLIALFVLTGIERYSIPKWQRERPSLGDIESRLTTGLAIYTAVHGKKPAGFSDFVTERGVMDYKNFPQERWTIEKNRMRYTSDCYDALYTYEQDRITSKITPKKDNWFCGWDKKADLEAPAFF